MSGAQLRENIRRWWQARSRRERQLLGAWSAALVILIAWFGVLSPLFGRIATLEKRIPLLETQLNRMRSLAAASGEDRRSGLASGPGRDDLRGTLAGLLAAQGSATELRALAAGRVELRLPELPFAEALDLLDRLRREAGVRIAALDIRPGKAAAGALIVVELECLP